MKREVSIDEAVKEVGGGLFKIIGLAQGVFLLLVILSPFLWLWIDLTAFWKTAVTGIAGVLLTKVLYSLAQTTVRKAVVEEFEHQEKEAAKNSRLMYKSKWQQRVDDALEAREKEREEKNNGVRT